MSQTNREGKRVARERLAEERRKQAIKDKRRKQYTVIGAVVVVIALVVGIGVLVQSMRANRHSADFVAAPAGATSGFSVPYGKASAPVTLTLYQDYRCPVCKIYEDRLGPTIVDLVNAGTLKVNYHLVKLIDSNPQRPGTGSLNSANAAMCANDAGKFADFNTLFYANQPDETTDPWADKNAVIALAKKVPGLDSPTFESCVNSGKYNSRVNEMWNHFQQVYKAYNAGTPTIILGENEAKGGKRGDQTDAAFLSSAAAFKAEVQAEAAGKGIK
jgi:protein-disulfide isomerase